MSNDAVKHGMLVLKYVFHNERDPYIELYHSADLFLFFAFEIGTDIATNAFDIYMID